MTEVQLAFDYAALDSETRIVVQQKTSEIRDRIKRTAQDIIEVGERLIDVKDRLGHGRFTEWLRCEFQWSERTAQNLMNVADTFKTANFAVLDADPSALYALAAPSVPEPARKEAIDRAVNGHRVTHAEAKDIIAKHKPPKVETNGYHVAAPLPIYSEAEDEAERATIESVEPEAPEPEFTEGTSGTLFSEDDADAAAPGKTPPDPAAAADRWLGLLKKLRNQINILCVSMPRRGGFGKLARKWPRKSIAATVQELKDIRDVAQKGIAELEGLNR